MSTLQAIQELQRMGRTLSLDAPNGGTDDDPTYLDAPDERPDPLGMMLDHERREHIGGALDQLSTQQRVVVVLTFGLDHASPLQLDDIGELFRYSKQRVYQVQRAGLLRMAPSLIPALGLSGDSVVPALARSRRKR